MKKLLLIILILNSILCFSQEQLKKRKTFALNIAADYKRNYTANIPEMLFFVKDKELQIYPGDSLFIETEIKNDTIFSMKIVDTIINPKNTIKLTFKIDDSDRNNITSTLEVQNPFDKN